ncbi:hypothetical protein FJ957_19970 [Mesorhizobium sp. B2-4-6]|nr:hypothetical protein FJ957_19970 [Mesorhizobium sp. B2-4-6]
MGRLGNFAVATRARADLILRKHANHLVEEVALRKLWSASLKRILMHVVVAEPLRTSGRHASGPDRRSSRTSWLPVKARLTADPLEIEPQTLYC